MLWKDIVFSYVCPSLGCLMSAAMYGVASTTTLTVCTSFVPLLSFKAPVRDLQRALLRGELQSLNPVPWAVMSGNCLGWCAYGYYVRDPFILASNVPGLVLSIWLNMGAAKLQYHSLARMLPTMPTDTTASIQPGNFVEEEALDRNIESSHDELLFVPQEELVLQIVVAWVVVLLVVGWSGWVNNPAAIIGIFVNVNLVFFYGAPLQSIKTVLQTKSSGTIHGPTVLMNFINTLFWLLYGSLGIRDPVIYGPNMFGAALGTIQAFLICYYPRQGRVAIVDTSTDLEEPLLTETEGNDGVLAATEHHQQVLDDAEQ
eukprot:scaffold7330_cov146-Cylindrotheca_fusiformis.AAC.4